MDAGPGAQRTGKWLIVEDEALVANLIRDALEEIDIDAHEPVSGVAEALGLLQQELPAGALLDVKLVGEFVYPVAEALAARNVPFAFLTGYGDGDIEPAFAGRPIVHKPFSIEDLQTAIRALMTT